LALDDLGVDYIEAGWPGSNPKDMDFFKEIKDYSLRNSKVAAFGSTCHKDKKASDDANLNAIIDSGADVAVIFGKTWLLHVEKVLKVSREANLKLVSDSVSYLKSHGIKVIFDAEHFYQGFSENEGYALSVLASASAAGSDTLVLADTNGGTSPNKIYEMTEKVCSSLDAKIGLHMHNDMGCAVSNTLLGVVAGAVHVQGTINGLGERTGNADLVQVIPSLDLKLNRNLLESHDLKKLKQLSSLVYELSGVAPNPSQPFVGRNAFAHKGGIHSDAVLKDTSTYEHIDPALVGNTRRIILSELSGAGSLVAYAKEFGITIDKQDQRVAEALKKIKALEKSGYSFDLAPESALLIFMEELGLYKSKIRIDHWKVTSESGSSTATVTFSGMAETAKAVGPVNAIDIALRKALIREYPELSEITLSDYRVILPGNVNNTESVVRTTIEFTNGSNRWRTMGVSSNIIDASFKGLLDGINFYLWRKSRERQV
jgi:2-isopropylmalate synthase